MARLTLLKELDSKWENVRADLRQDLESIEQAINRLFGLPPSTTTIINTTGGGSSSGGVVGPPGLDGDEGEAMLPLMTLPPQRFDTGDYNAFRASNRLFYRVRLDGAFWGSDVGGAGTSGGATIGPSSTTFTDGPAFQLGTDATSGHTAFVNSLDTAARELNFAWDFDVTQVVNTDVGAITTVRYFAGVGVNNEDADPVTAAYIGFRYSTATDAGWVGVTYDGTQAVTGVVAPIAANTKYFLRIRKVGGTVYFSVNGGTEVSTTTHVPASNTGASLVSRCTTLANVARSLWVRRWWADYGS